MEKEEAIAEFLKGLRIAFNNACAYNRDHPYFKKIIERFKGQLDPLFNFLDPIQMGVTPDSLFIDGKYWGKATLYIELASMLHVRKIKSIQIRKGIGIEELMNFLSAISRPTKEILRKGGLQNLIKPESSPNISVQQLDYSELLRDGTEDSKDVWVYLFQEAVNEENPEKMDQFADNFQNIINKFESKDLLEDEEAKKSIYGFLDLLKEKRVDKFNVCTKELLKFILKSKDIPGEKQLEKVKQFSKDINNDDLSQILLDEVLKKEKFNNSSFLLFMKLANLDKQKEIANSLGKKIEDTYSLKNNLTLRKNLKEILFVSDQEYISSLYKTAITSLLKSDSLEGSITFDAHLAQANYFIILLNLFLEAETKEDEDSILDLLIKESDRLMLEKDLRNLRFLIEAIDRKRVGIFEKNENVKDLAGRVFSFIENIAFEESDSPDFDFFVSAINISSLGFNGYLNKIFEEEKVNHKVIKLLLKLFKDKLPIVYAKYEERRSNIGFSVKFVKSLEMIDSAWSVDMLKNIFHTSNNMLKIEVIRSMQKLTNRDNEFLISVLLKEGVFLKKEVLSAMKNDDALMESALKKILGVRNPFGLKNKIVIENISIIESLRIKGAIKYLLALSRRTFFWNAKLRQKAREAIRGLGNAQ